MAVLTNIYFVFFTCLIPIATESASYVLNQSLKTNICIIQNAVYFLGTPYVPNTLESSGEEKLTVFNNKYDCVTFVEYILALSIYQTQTIETKKSIYQIITNLRYRDGIIDGYGSRLHYFTEWILRNEKNGTIKNITSVIGGKAFDKKINFMTTHSSKYPKLQNNKDLQEVKAAENFLNGQALTYIPKEDVTLTYPHIQHGDIIAITTGIDGLDIVHTGFAYRKGDSIHLLHASEKEGKVVISELPLSEYMQKNKSQSGIMVARVN